MIFSFDVGNGFVKAKSEKVTLVAPSAIAKESALGESTIDGLDNTTNYHIFQSPLDDAVSYVWGEGLKAAVEPRKLLNTYTHHKRYKNKRFKLLCQFILAELASDFSDEELQNITVVTGMPSSEVKTEDDQQVKEFLLGKHLITRDGRELVVNVKDVRILEQPIGTLLNLYMNDDGQISKTLKTSTISVIDFGAGTTILDTYKNLKRLDDESDTYYEGMMDVYKDISNKISKASNIKSIDEITVEDGIQNNYTLQLSARHIIPFDEEAKEAAEDFVDQIIAKVDRTLSSRDHIDEFIVTGGGSQIVGQAFLESFGEDAIKIVEDSQLANVNGFYKFGTAIERG